MTRRQFFTSLLALPLVVKEGLKGERRLGLGEYFPVVGPPVLITCGMIGKRIKSLKLGQVITPPPTKPQ